MNHPNLDTIQLKRREEKRILLGHPWIYSNEIANDIKKISPGTEVDVLSHQKKFLGRATVNPHSLIAARIYAREPLSLDTAFFLRKFESALEFRNAQFALPYYRLLNAEGDGVPGLIIDRFDNHFVVQLNIAGMENKKIQIVEALQTLFPTLASIFLRNDSNIRRQEKLLLYNEVISGQLPDEIIIPENNAKFSVPIGCGQKTGWFYDHRQNRKRLLNYVQGKKVLDVFSYLGAWGIAAACADASSVTTVDESKTACEGIRRNATLNQCEDKITVLAGDAFDVLRTMHAENNHFDIIILDPPAFVKKRKDLANGLIAYQRINELALRLLNPKGILISCSCSMLVSAEALHQTIIRAQAKSHCNLQIIERGFQDIDHPIHFLISETDYLKVFFLRRYE